jgi:hypothetical protein
MAGETMAGEVMAGETMAGEVMAGETMAGELTPGFVCDQAPLSVQWTRVSPEDDLSFTGVDDRFNFTNYMWVEFAGQPEAGDTVSFSETTLEGCRDRSQTCIYLGLQCEEDGCSTIYLATSGELEMVSTGRSGDEELTFELSGVTFSELDREAGALLPPDGNCLPNQTISALRPRVIGDTIPTGFSLQSCDTGEMVNVYDFAEYTRGIFLIATARWCPACRGLLTELFMNFFPQLTPDVLKPMIVVTEDDNYEPATLDFCRSYATRYTEDLTYFYVDPNLESSLQNLWYYPDEDGIFGLPWKAVIEGGTRTYIFSDGAPGLPELDEVINGLLME